MASTRGRHGEPQMPPLPGPGFCYRIAHARKTCPRSAEKKHEAASSSAFLRNSRALPIVRLGQHLHDDVTASSFTAIPRCAPPDRDDPADCHLWVTTRRRSMDIRDATNSRRCRSSLFPASCATFRLDIFHFLVYNGYFQPPTSGRSWGHLRMLLALKKKVTR